MIKILSLHSLAVRRYLLRNLSHRMAPPLFPLRTACLFLVLGVLACPVRAKDDVLPKNLTATPAIAAPGGSTDDTEIPLDRTFSFRLDNAPRTGTQMPGGFSSGLDLNDGATFAVDGLTQETPIVWATTTFESPAPLAAVPEGHAVVFLLSGMGALLLFRRRRG